MPRPHASPALPLERRGSERVRTEGAKLRRAVRLAMIDSGRRRRREIVGGRRWRRTAVATRSAAPANARGKTRAPAAAYGDRVDWGYSQAGAETRTVGGYSLDSLAGTIDA